jgi:glutamine amidotransferase
MSVRVCIVDYGSGNVRSVLNIFKDITESVQISNDAAVMNEATHVVLPGVGAFGEAMQKIDQLGLEPAMRRQALEKGKPFLGICVGMQVLAEEGLEFGRHKGMGWLPGSVRALDGKGERLPHIGWNDLVASKPSPLLEGLPPSPDFYFVHGYAMDTPAENVLARCRYGEEFAAVVGRDNVYGVQFHPEKSQAAGKILLKNFLRLR